MSAQTSMLGLIRPTTATLSTRLLGGIVWVGAKLKLWRQRSRERKQLARWLSTSEPGFVHDTSISCIEAYLEASKPFWRA